jgi:hypothetical protein
MQRNLILIFLVVLSLFVQASKAQPASNRSMGLKLLDEAEYRSIPIALVPLGGVLPAQVDLSGDMPPVGDQGNQLSCTAWSVAYAVRTYIEKREQKWDVTDPSRQFSPSFIYNQLAHGNCNEGVHFAAAFNIMTEKGAATMNLMPYYESNCSSQPGIEVKQQAQNYRIAGYRRVNVQDPTEVKAQLAAGFPVLIAVMTDDIFLNLAKDQIWKSAGNPSGPHAVVLVGYDDAKRAFRLINSWGRSWGADGYGWIDYDHFLRVTREAYIMASFPREEHPVTKTSPPEPTREARVQILGVDHNINAGTPNAGMNVIIQYTLKGYSGNSGQIVLHFLYTNDGPVGTTSEYYRDIWNNAAAGTQPFHIDKDDYTNYVFTIFVPYNALNIPVGEWMWDGSEWRYDPLRSYINVVADIFINDFGIAQSNFEPFYIDG